MHGALPVSEYVPAEQTVTHEYPVGHDVVEVHECPVGHTVHADWPPSEYVPASTNVRNMKKRNNYTKKEWVP